MEEVIGSIPINKPKALQSAARQPDAAFIVRRLVVIVVIWKSNLSRSDREMEVSPSMCRNIKPLFNFEPPVTEDEVRAASLQFVRKITGFNKPSKANERAFLDAVDQITEISTHLLLSLKTSAEPRNREEEAAKAKARNAARFPA